MKSKIYKRKKINKNRRLKVLTVGDVCLRKPKFEILLKEKISST